jgi:hypothetical protein
LMITSKEISCVPPLFAIVNWLVIPSPLPSRGNGVFGVLEIETRQFSVGSEYLVESLTYVTPASRVSFTVKPPAATSVWPTFENRIVSSAILLAWKTSNGRTAVPRSRPLSYE